MSGLEVAATQQVIGEAAKKSESLLKALFKESFAELGGMIADQVRLRRFNNQVAIFEKAQKKLKEKNIDTKKVSLKALAPLLDFISLEEEPTIQDMWANLLVNILEKDEDLMFQQNAISSINKLSIQEAELLTFLYRKFIDSTLRYWERERGIRLDDLESKVERAISFKERELEEKFNITSHVAKYRLSNLVGLNLLQWKTSGEMEIVTEKSETFQNFLQKSKEIFHPFYTNTTPPKPPRKQKVEVNNEDSILFTPFGIKLMFVVVEK